MRKAVPDPPDGYTAVDPREWTRAWRRVIATPSVKLVGYACADWADYRDGSRIKPGVDLLMLACGIKSDKTVRDALKAIRDWGLIWRYAEGSMNGRSGGSDEYRLTFPADISPIPMYSPDWDPPPLQPCGYPPVGPVENVVIHRVAAGEHRY